MSKLNPRNYQLALAFNDSDLRAPGHDEIMHWLSNWVRQESNIRSLIRPSYRGRESISINRLDEQSKVEIAKLPTHKQNWVTNAFNHQHKETRIKVAELWPDEPMVELNYKKSEWELPLSSERGQPTGFCDLYCEYQMGDVLSHATTHVYSFASSEEFFVGERSNFSKVEESQAWRQYTTVVRLFFEVKTKIPSVGELMRQIQLYRTSPTFRGSPDCGPRSVNKFIVVAPPNNEAASVCAEHEIHFIEYRPE